MSDFDPVDVAAQDAAKAETSAAEALAAARDADSLKWLMADARGRHFMRRLLERSGIFRSSFSQDAGVMSFREGERNVGLSLLAQITEHTPEHLNDVLLSKD